ncbi:GNAT family N-acetyltransferase [Ferrimonas aestuarii]|uniref:GNAT family N-acetyltransferase n=1 Tax=Ferrimonas aestuarii TaxID=2569539 RepID=A0A4U1BEG3_9GAMM|nr:GNAT family N-acetyltransferase [Ferrimonas aestuarii]TKB49588.1 GNAT family N-acetyltransferase [Ferrimonas aestuarii]
MDEQKKVEIKAEYLTAEELRVAASLLYNAYYDDLFFQQAFGRKDYGQKLRAAIREELTELWQHQQRVVGFYVDGALLGVACIIDHQYPQGESRYWSWRIKMALGTGWAPTRHWIEREDELKRLLPSNEYWLLQLIAIHPQHQNTGLGSQFLTALLELQNRSESSGLAVFTYQPEHQQFFQQHGFDFIADVEVADISGQLLYQPANREAEVRLAN